jgi:hypothetical protein
MNPIEPEKLTTDMLLQLAQERIRKQEFLCRLHEFTAQLEAERVIARHLKAVRNH